jgi:hypothetical protein
MQTPTTLRRSGPMRHAFGFDAIMANPDHRRFTDWYARTSFFAPGRAELGAVLSEPETGFDKAA